MIETEAKDALALWWLDEKNMKKIHEFSDKREAFWDTIGIPEYLFPELRDAYGRNGRGRLWVPNEIECESIEWSDSHSNASRCRECAGLVFLRSDFAKLSGLPGFITETNLNTIGKEVSI